MVETFEVELESGKKVGVELTMWVDNEMGEICHEIAFNEEARLSHADQTLVMSAVNRKVRQSRNEVIAESAGDKVDAAYDNYVARLEEDRT